MGMNGNEAFLWCKNDVKQDELRNSYNSDVKQLPPLHTVCFEK